MTNYKWDPYMIHFMRNIADKGGYKALKAIKEQFPYTPSLSYIQKCRNATRLAAGLNEENLDLLS